MRLGSIGVLALTASYWASRNAYAADVVNLFRPAVALMAVLLVALSIPARAYGVAALAVILTGANIYLLVDAQTGIPVSTPSGSRLPPISLATFDTVSDASLGDFTSWVKDPKSRPDIVGLQNMSNPWRTRAAQLSEVYPYSASAMHKEVVKEDIVSRFPIMDAAVFRPAGGRTAVRATIDIDGVLVKVFVIDPNKATNQDRWSERNQYLGLVSQWIASQGQSSPTIMMGDWNITPWSPFFADVFTQSGLLRGDSGLIPPPSHTLAKLPIPGLGLNDDHIAVSRRVSVEGCGLGPDLNSDHLPLICKLQVH